MAAMAILLTEPEALFTRICAERSALSFNPVDIEIERQGASRGREEVRVASECYHCQQQFINNGNLISFRTVVKMVQ